MRRAREVRRDDATKAVGGNVAVRKLKRLVCPTDRPTGSSPVSPMKYE